MTVAALPLQSIFEVPCLTTVSPSLATIVSIASSLPSASRWSAVTPSMFAVQLALLGHIVYYFGAVGEDADGARTPQPAVTERCEA